MPVRKLSDRLRRPFFVLVFAVIAVFLGARTVGAVSHTPTASRAALATHCDRQHPVDCKRAVAYWRRRATRLSAAVSWQQHVRITDAHRLLAQTRGKQPFAYAARLAYLACVSFRGDASACHAPSEMIGVGHCESGLQAIDPNHSGSSADGWTQWLLSTWLAHPAGQQGWSRYDVLAMAIATEALVAHDSGWREWSCAWAAAA